MHTPCTRHAHAMHMLCTCLRQPQREPLLPRCRALPREAADWWRRARHAGKGACRLEVRPVPIGRALELLRVARGVPRTCVRHERGVAGSAQRQAISRMVQGRWARTVLEIPGDRHVVALSARLARREARPHGLLHHMGRRAILVYLALLPPSGHLAKAAGLANRAVTNICSRTAMTRTSSREELAGLDQRHPAWSRHFYSWKSTVTLKSLAF